MKKQLLYSLFIFCLCITGCYKNSYPKTIPTYVIQDIVDSNHQCAIYKLDLDIDSLLITKGGYDSMINLLEKEKTLFFICDCVYPQPIGIHLPYYHIYSKHIPAFIILIELSKDNNTDNYYLNGKNMVDTAQLNSCFDKLSEHKNYIIMFNLSYYLNRVSGSGLEEFFHNNDVSVFTEKNKLKIKKLRAKNKVFYIRYPMTCTE